MTGMNRGCRTKLIDDAYRVLVLSLVNTYNFDMTTNKGEFLSLIVEKRGPWLHDIDQVWGFMVSIRRHLLDYFLPNWHNIVLCTLYSPVGCPKENLLYSI